MNRLAHLGGLKLRVSRAMLDKWLNPGAAEYPPSLAGLQLFCQATGNMRPLEAYVKGFDGVRLIDENEWDLLQWAKVERQVRQGRRRARQLAPKAGID
jgi:hypothetical protein